MKEQKPGNSGQNQIFFVNLSGEYHMSHVFKPYGHYLNFYFCDRNSIIIFCYEFCLVGYTISLNVCFLEW